MLILDRIEDTIAYISTDSDMLCIDRSRLSANAREGDVLTVQHNLYVTDLTATETRKAKVRELLRSRLNLNK